MKYYIPLLFTLITLGILSPSCDEVSPFTLSEVDTTTVDPGATGEIDTIYSDTTFVGTVAAAQPKVVILEEYSGVRCVTCPAGHIETEAIINTHKGQVAAVVIHAGNLIFPYNGEGALYLDDGLSLYSASGATAVPSATVDRIVFDGQDNIALGNPTSWASKVALQKQESPPVNVYVYDTYNEATRQLKIYVQLRYTETIATPHRLSVAVVESGIVRTQLTPDGEQEDYVHNHVMRIMPTSANGWLVEGETGVGGVIVKSFDVTLEEDWLVENMEIVAFVHETGTGRKVLQGGADYVGLD